MKSGAARRPDYPEVLQWRSISVDAAWLALQRLLAEPVRRCESHDTLIPDPALYIHAGA